MTEKIDYQNECLFFLKLKESNIKLTQVDYCQRRAEELGQPFSLGYFKNVLRKIKHAQKSENRKEKKHSKSDIHGDAINNNTGEKQVDRRDYEALRLEFLHGNWKTLSAFARDKGIKPSSSHFRKKSKTWLREKKILGKKVDQAVVKNLTKKRAEQKTRDVYDQIRALEWNLLDAADFISDSISDWAPIKSVSGCYYAALCIKEMHAVLKEIGPFLQELEHAFQVSKVFDNLDAGKIDIDQATIQFMKLGIKVPKIMQIMLSKGIDRVVEDNGEMISQEKIVAYRKEHLALIEAQRRDFVPLRVREVAELKAELSDRDSFAAQKAIENRKNHPGGSQKGL